MQKLQKLTDGSSPPISGRWISLLVLFDDRTNTLKFALICLIKIIVCVRTLVGMLLNSYLFDRRDKDDKEIVKVYHTYESNNCTLKFFNCTSKYSCGSRIIRYVILSFVWLFKQCYLSAVWQRTGTALSSEWCVDLSIHGEPETCMLTKGKLVF